MQQQVLLCLVLCIYCREIIVGGGCSVFQLIFSRVLNTFSKCYNAIVGFN